MIIYQLQRYAYSLGIFLSFISGCFPLRAQEIPEQNERDFCDIVNEMKASIAYLNVCTNVDSIAIVGTAFLIDSRGYLATCAHAFFDTVRQDSVTLIPDTSRVYLKFELAREFLRAQIVAVRIDRDISILQLAEDQPGTASIPMRQVSFAETRDICDGLDIACTGYDLAGQTDLRFGRTYRRLTTHRGIISSIFVVGPADTLEFLDAFQADMLINPGASGSPVYEASTGKVVGMIKGTRGKELLGVPINFGLADCVPGWAIIRLAESVILPDLR
jgi:hypothetical protein